VAIYHYKENHYTGDILVHGGYGYAQYGGSGTAYLQDQSSSKIYNKLIIDNGGYTSSQTIEEVEKLSLASPSGSTSYYTYNNVHVAVDTSYLSSHYISGVTNSGLFISNKGIATITFSIPHVLFVDHVRVYPYCGS